MRRAVCLLVKFRILSTGLAGRLLHLNVMAMVIELSDRLAARVTAAASARGVTAGLVVAELVEAGLTDPGFDHEPDNAFDVLVAEVVAEHRDILDVLAAT